jgi:hypothetical protein
MTEVLEHGLGMHETMLLEFSYTPSVPKWMSLKLVRTYIIDSLDMDRSKSRCIHDGLNRDMQRLLPATIIVGRRE